MSGEASEKRDIATWWADNPMTYGQEHGTVHYRMPDSTEREVAFGTKEFFEAADDIFYSWNTPRHAPDAPFGRIFDYQRYAGEPVLEVGCGMGCMSMNWAKRGAFMTSVDLNPVAIKQTQKRFELFGLQGNILQADGENLPFEDDTFAYAYSWGVLHHSPEPHKSIGELCRVLHPGAQVGAMLYHRRAIAYLYRTVFMEGFMNMERKYLNPVELASRYGDGFGDEGNPHTWPITPREAKEELFLDFEDVEVAVFGTELDDGLNRFFPDLAKRWMPRPLVDALARRWGWSLWITGRKPKA